MPLLFFCRQRQEQRKKRKEKEKNQMAKTEGSRYLERNTAALGDDRGRKQRKSCRYM
jgi:hypothetical protein